MRNAAVVALLLGLSGGCADTDGDGVRGSSTTARPSRTQDRRTPTRPRIHRPRPTGWATRATRARTARSRPTPATAYLPLPKGGGEAPVDRANLRERSLVLETLEEGEEGPAQRRLASDAAELVGSVVEFQRRGVGDC